MDLRRLPLIVLLSLFCHQAAASQLTQLSEGNWSGGAYSDDGTGQFSHCAASAVYNSGLFLIVSVGRDYSWSLGLANPNATLNTGQTTQIQFRIDGGPWLTATGNTISPTLIDVPMSGDSTLISMFRLGHLLQIAGVRSVLSFDLTGSSRLIVDLAQCVASQLAFEKPGPAAPPSSPVATSSPPVVDNNPPNQHVPVESSGTGIVITSAGDVLTNEHVIDGCTAITVEWPGDVPQHADVLAEDATSDLAVLKAKGPLSNAGDVAHFRVSNQIKMGEAIAVFGFPLAGALSTSGNLTSGIITALAGLGDNSSHFQISAPIQPGNSGGPLLDYHGNVVGLVDSKLNEVAWASRTGNLPQNVNFAIKANVLTNFLDAHSISYSTNSTDTESLDLPTVGARAQQFTVFVACTG